MAAEKAPTKTPTDPPLVSFSVTNPITYIKLWWKKIIANEGIDLRIRIHPLTTLVILLLLFGGTFGLGVVTAIVNQVPLLKEVIPLPTPTASPDPWTDAAYSGILRKIEPDKYYLQTSDAQAINLIIPTNVNLEKYIGRRIFASGKVHSLSGVLEVTSATDLEVLPLQVQTVPTIAPTATPVSVDSPEPLDISEPTL